MTAVYAHMHDSTHPRRVRTILPDPCRHRRPPARLRPSRGHRRRRMGQTPPVTRADALPNGYCGRPPQQDCPHPNACLTCPNFQTTAEFLPVHRQQAELTRELLTAAETSGRQRQADNHRKVLINLDKIITSLRGTALEPSRAIMTDRVATAARGRASPTRARPCSAPRPPCIASPNDLASRSPSAASPTTAGVSRSWLYQQPQLRAQIDQLRDQPTSPTGQPSLPRAGHRRLATATTTHLPRGNPPAAGREPDATRPARPPARHRTGRRHHQTIMTPVTDMSTTTLPPKKEPYGQNDQENSDYAEDFVKPRSLCLALS